MKIKFILLLLILSGIIVISGFVDAEAQPPTYKAPEYLYRTIFYPYAGLLHGEGMHHREPPPEGFNPGPESTHAMRDAASLLDSNIEKAEAISIRLEAEIQHHKAEGKDVSRLETLLEEYNLLVEEAKQYRALADAAAGEENSSSITDSENGSSESTEREYLIRSQKSMIQANHVLKDVFDEFQHLMPGSEELNSTSRLTAAGDGKAILMGSFTLDLRLGEGKMAILDLSRDSEIDIKGDYTFEEKHDRQDKVLLYHIRSADVKISGSRKTVLLNDENITLVTDGEGYAAFQGNGTYRVEEAGITVKEENWANLFFEEGMNPDDCGPDGKECDKATGRRQGSNITEADRAYPETENRRSFIKEDT